MQLPKNQKMLTQDKYKMKGTTGAKLKHTGFDYFNYILLGAFALLSIYPMIYVLAGSFNEGLDYIAGGIYFWPRSFTLENYKMVLTDPRLWDSYLITMIRTILGTISGIIFTAMVAYGMSRKNLVGRSIYYRIFIFTMFFGGGLVPYFLVILMLGLFDNFLVYIIPALFSVYNMLVFVNFFKSIPEEIHESAKMDGASEITIFFRIILPLSLPVISTVGLWVAVGHWNSFFDTMIFTSSEKLWTLQYYLMKVIKEASIMPGGIPLPPEMLANISPETISLAAIIISVIPILVLYPLIFRFLTKGVIIGSLKG